MGFARVVRGVGLSMLLAQGAFAGELPLSGEAAPSAVEILQPLAENTIKVVSTEAVHIALSPESKAISRMLVLRQKPSQSLIQSPIPLKRR